jgi:hypothetical protein
MAGMRDFRLARAMASISSVIWALASFPEALMRALAILLRCGQS